jgi:hypothetical protein
MKSRLPADPMEALSLSAALRFVVKTIHSAAHWFGFWKRPSRKAAADFEDMSLLHKIYWGYKSRNPIIKMEKVTDDSEPLETIFTSDFNPNRSIELPPGFEQMHTVTFGAVGDMIKVEGLENSSDFLYESVADLIFDKDISFGNLESQLTSKGIGGYTFSDKDTPPLCCSIDQYDALRKHNGKSFTALQLANNHTMDMGVEGLETTLKRLEKDNIMDIGTNRRPDEREKGRIVEKNGIRIGFISATYGLNGKEISAEKEFMVNVIKFHRDQLNSKQNSIQCDLSLLKCQIRHCRENNCDIIIAALHWGYEYEFYPRAHQVKIAHTLAEEGVDVIVGHHSHVVQPVEFYRPQCAPDKTTVIAYSLGNLTSSFSAPYLVLSGILNLSFVKGSLNGDIQTFVRDVTFSPVVQREYIDVNKSIIRLERLGTLSEAKDEVQPEEKNYISAVETFARSIFGL